MPDPVREMTDELVRDADNLVFLELGELLRVQGQVAAARKVALTGLQRHPELPNAHDLYARVLVDANEFEHARKIWEAALKLDARHQGAHKGLGFLHYRDGDLDGALDHLELALATDPTNDSVVQALQAVRNAAEALGDTEDEPFAGFDGADPGMLLLDTSGRALAGKVVRPDGADCTDEVAAHLGGVSQEVDRTVRMLGLGEWQWLVVEATDGNLHLAEPIDDVLLLMVRKRGVPVGHLTLLAERAGVAAHSWFEAQAR
ncbi:MAG: tetratricopeptide repeat protein [Gemmatimonadetes bacterium]|nr:tetratricopeptide repeat protein [Gemmatimonadota bacterium]